MVILGVRRLLITFGAGLSAFLLSSCGSFRTLGTYRTSSDYSVEGSPSAVITDEEMAQPRAQLSQQSQYIPHAPFRLTWPVTQVRINRGFHPPQDRHHSGLDLGGTRGTAILAAHEGVVIYAGRDFRGYGNMILVEYNKEWATLYGHLDTFLVPENTVVNPGDAIATMGSTGRATGVHLHFELMHNREPIDPLSYLTRPAQFTGRDKMRGRKHARKTN